MCVSQKFLYILLSLPVTIGQAQFNWQPTQCPETCGLPATVVKCIGPYGQTVADTFCDSYTKPNCPATPPCAPFWSSGNVQCPTACGYAASTVTRTVQCKGTINGVVQVIADSYCDQYTKPVTTVQCPATYDCVTYQWKLGNEQCPTYCGLLASNVTRSLVCIASSPAGTVVADSYCSAYAKPDRILMCPATAPCAPFWHASDVQCPTYCGLAASTMQRTVTCQGTVNNVVVDIADSFCDASSKPPTSVDCAATAPCAPFWHASDVQCPTYCGLAASTIQRTVTCQGTVNNVVVDIADSFCDASSKPPTSVDCPATAPCAPFWHASDVQCPTYCGLAASTVQRTVTCQGTVNNVVVDIADSFCDASSKPPTSVDCPATAPCAPFWHASDVQCPTYCGLAASTVQRTVTCQGTVNNVVVDIADSFCDASSKPPTSVDCPATAPCAPFWHASDVQCPTYCGLAASTVQRTVTCQGTVNNVVVDIADSFCDASSKPPTSVDCPATAPCAPFWHASDVQCPTYCGLPASTMQRNVTCQGTINNVVVVIADSYCDASSKPPTSVNCAATAPCAPFWHASDVQCPSYCGLAASTVQRTVTCQGTINNVVVDIADSFCDTSSKPPTSVDCPATAPCAPFWHTSDVQCPTYCGLPASTMSRTVTCQGTINNVVVVIADSYCDASSKPSTSVDCSATAPCAPFWSTSDVQCPTYCGLLASTVSRTVQCKGTVNNVVIVIADSFCDASSKPPSTVPCPATAPCAPFWYTSNVTCPTYCGLLASQQPQTVQCKGTVNGNVIVLADSYCDLASKPSPTVTCPATAPCAPYWFTSDVTCPTYCGTAASNLPRTVVCKGTVANVVVVVADSYCSPPKPSATVYCPATAACVTYEWQVGSAYCPTECGHLASTLPLTLTCLAKNGNSAGTPVADSFCAGLTKPGTILNCPATPPCAPYWFTSPVNCPTYCGQSATTTTRIVECRGTVNGQVIAIDDQYCPPPKPSTTVTCPATSACAIYKWKLGNVSCPTECGHDACELTRPLVCVAITPDNTAGSTVDDSYCDAYTKPDTSVQCNATEPCCAAASAPCSYDEDCCSGVCVIEETSQPTYEPTTPGTKSTKDSKGTKSTKDSKGTKSTKDSKGTKSTKDSKGTKSTKDSKGTKSTKNDSENSYTSTKGTTKSTKGTKSTKSTKAASNPSSGSSQNSYGSQTQSGSATNPSTSGKSASSPKQTTGKKRGYEAPKGTCGCLNNAASCTKDAQCCSGSCQNYVCAPKSTYYSATDSSSQSSGNAGVAVGVGVGGAVGAAVAVGFVVRRRRRAKQMSREDRAASEPLTPHTKATTTPRKVDVVA